MAHTKQHCAVSWTLNYLYTTKSRPQSQIVWACVPGCPRMCLGVGLVFGVGWLTPQGEEVWKHGPHGSLSPLSLM